MTYIGLGDVKGYDIYILLLLKHRQLNVMFETSSAPHPGPGTVLPCNITDGVINSKGKIVTKLYNSSTAGSSQIPYRQANQQLLSRHLTYNHKGLQHKLLMVSSVWYRKFNADNSTTAMLQQSCRLTPGIPNTKQTTTFNNRVTIQTIHQHLHRFLNAFHKQNRQFGLLHPHQSNASINPYHHITTA